MALTYNISRQRRIVDGRYTALTLLICSLLLWGAGALFYAHQPQFTYAPQWAKGLLPEAAPLVMVGVAFLFYILSSLLLNTYAILERRVAWQPFMMLFIVAANFYIHPEVAAAFTQLVVVAVLGLSFLIDKVQDLRQLLFCQFSLVATSALFFPQFILLLPLLLAYPALCGKLSVKAFMSALMGVAMPVWVVWALMYLFPGLASLPDTLNAWFDGLLQMSSIKVTPSMFVRLCLEPIVTLTAIVHFAFTGSIGRSYLRRRMTFCVVLYIALWLMGWLQPQFFSLYYIWRLPVISLLATYIYIALPAKTSNVFMVTTMLLWVMSSIVEIWIG